jgi:hypothetical protein
VQNYVSISHDHGRAASGVNAVGAASNINLQITSGGNNFNLNHAPPANATPIQTANALVALINATGVVTGASFQNNAIFGVATRSADILITNPGGAAVTVTAATSNDTRQTVAAPAANNALIVWDGTNWLVGSINQRSLMRNYDAGDNTIDIYVAQTLTAQTGGGTPRGTAMIQGGARPAAEQGIAGLRDNAFVIASSADNTANNPFTIPHEAGHCLLDAIHVTGDTTQLMRNGTSGADAEGASKRYLDANRTFDGIGGGAGGALNQVTRMRGHRLVTND